MGLKERSWDQTNLKRDHPLERRNENMYFYHDLCGRKGHDGPEGLLGRKCNFIMNNISRDHNADACILTVFPKKCPNITETVNIRLQHAKSRLLLTSNQKPKHSLIRFFASRWWNINTGLYNCLSSTKPEITKP